MGESTRTVSVVLKAPFTAIVSGPTGSGKTRFLHRLIASTNDCIDHPMIRIVYCYGAWQKFFEEFPDTVEFHEGIIDPKSGLSRDDDGHTLVIFDDLMDDVGKSSAVVDLYTKYSHHRNISVINVVQNLFLQRPEMRNISLNTQYFFIFKNPRNAAAISTLAQQCYPGKTPFLQWAYADATSRPYTHLFLDMKADTDEKMRVIGNFCSEDDDIPMTVYMPNA